MLRRFLEATHGGNPGRISKGILEELFKKYFEKFLQMMMIWMMMMYDFLKECLEQIINKTVEIPGAPQG